jgi:hypothetical protein
MSSIRRGVARRAEVEAQLAHDGEHRHVEAPTNRAHTKSARHRGMARERLLAERCDVHGDASGKRRASRAAVRRLRHGAIDYHCDAFTTVREKASARCLQ